MFIADKTDVNTENLFHSIKTYIHDFLKTRTDTENWTPSNKKQKAWLTAETLIQCYCVEKHQILTWQVLHYGTWIQNTHELSSYYQNYLHHVQRTRQIITLSKLTLETTKKGVKYAQNNNKNTRTLA